MKNQITDTFLSQTVKNMLKNKLVHGAVLCVENGNQTISWVGSAGNIQKDSPYFIASVTKLYITAVLLCLRAESRLQFDDPIIKFFPEAQLKGLHVLNGIDYTHEITVSHLMSNTSGIPDYFMRKSADGKKPFSSLLAGVDEAWPLNKIIERVKTLKPDFKPGQKGKALYSDTNYELLGGLIENITGKKLADVFSKYLFDPLNLKHTYAYQDIYDKRPVPFYYKSQPLLLPQYMASVTAEGGIVSTSQEVIIFLKAFFNGFFFPKEEIEKLKKWHFILYPGQLYFGIGLEKLWIPRLFSPQKAIKEVFGFWGHSGAFAFYHPQSDLYFTGTANQANGFGHSAALKAMITIIQST